MNLDKDKRWGIIGTIIFHLVVLVILFVVNLKPPDPPRPVIGLEVNLGYSDQGMGDIQPKKAAQTNARQTKPQPKSSEEKVVTQDIEESVNLKNSKSTKVTPPTPTEPEEPKVDEKFLFTKKNSKTNGGSEGVTNKPGDQGRENGSKTSTNYVGDGGDGDIAWHLAGRKSHKLPKPVYNSAEQGTVIVKIWVNKDGKVVNARVNVTGTTTSNTKLQNLAISAALKATFNSNPDGPEVQTGTITYQFVL